MHVVEIAMGLMVLCGALFMTVAIVLGEKTTGHIPHEVLRRWRVMLVLMVFFLLGYLVFATLLLSHLRFPSELITGPVFLGGAVFVYIVINLTRDTITRIKTAEEDLKKLNETLEDRIVERTAELQRSREFFRTVLDSLNDSVMIIDVKDFKIVGANASFLREFGVLEKEVIGRNCYEVTHDRREVCAPPDDICPLAETVKTGKHQAAEHIHYTKNREKIYVAVSTSPLRDNVGNIVRIVHVSRDISDHKRAEKRLQESEKRYRMLFESAGDAIFILEAEGEHAGNIVAANKTAADVHGYSVDELLHKNIRDLDTPGAAQSAGDLMQRILSGEWVKIEIDHRRKNGTVFPVEVSAGLLELGDHKHILAFDRDITERKNAENMLLRSRQTMQAILGSMPYGVVIIDRNKKIIDVNEAALALMKYDSKEQIVGSTCNRTLCPAQEGKCPILEMHEQLDRSERILIAKDGKRIPILKTVVPVEIDGEEVLLEAFIDITERKNAEDRLKTYSAELEQVNEEMRNFTYIVSHDLRAPLVNIRGFSEEFKHTIREGGEFLTKYIPVLNEEDKKKYSALFEHDMTESVEFIGASVSRMDSLIESILKLSRLGRSELKPAFIKTEQLVHSLLKTLQHQLESRHAQVRVAPLPDLLIDRTAIERIFGNLLENAVKYLEPSRPGSIEISAKQEPEETVFTIRDNGRGIAPDDIKKVFDPFRRVGRQDVPGEGMGLTYVKALVRRLGGRIWCESELGMGTAFSFTIPLEPMIT